MLNIAINLIKLGLDCGYMNIQLKLNSDLIKKQFKFMYLLANFTLKIQNGANQRTVRFKLV